MYNGKALTINDSILSFENISNKFSIGYTYTSDSFKNLNVVSYYINNNQIDVNYTKDLLGNISKVMYRGKMIGEYIYDGWGNCEVKELSISNDIDRCVLYHNPFRYKGYYYDVETGLFYCNSRYYSPELCCWISPDDIEYLDPESVNGLNLYCYCFNNPVNYKQRPVSSGGSVISSSISVGGSSVGGNLGGVENSSAPWWASTAVGAIPDFILGMRYLATSGMHSKFAYATNTRYMHPIMGGTWRWFGKSSSSFETVAQGTFKQILTGDARAGFGAIAKSVGGVVGLNALVNFGFNLYENNWQVDSVMLVDTAIDTVIGVGSYYLVAGAMSLVTAGLLAAGVALPGIIVIGGVVILSIGFEHVIRAISGYWD